MLGELLLSCSTDLSGASVMNFVFLGGYIRSTYVRTYLSPATLYQPHAVFAVALLPIPFVQATNMAV